MFLGIEIGGTKLQLGLSQGGGTEFVSLERFDIDPRHGATGILDQIEKSVTAILQRRQSIRRIGIGFGGPVDAASGRVIKSHHIAGWDDVPLAKWCRDSFGVETVLGNDCDVAALAEARYGAGRGKHSVFYVTVGTGVGGGFVVNGKLHGAGRPAVAEIGHLRPGLWADHPEETVESLASGWGIAAAAQDRITSRVSRPLSTFRRLGYRPHKSREEFEFHRVNVEQTQAEFAADLLDRAGGNLDQLTAKLVAQAAADGNELAGDVLDHACQALGWAVAQVITLLAPEVIVVGGGVSQIGDALFFAPLRGHVSRYVFPPLAESYEIVPSRLGELVVLYGAVALAEAC